MYRAAAAANIQLWRDQILKDLEHRGVLVVDAFPDELTAPLVNQYLEFKAKHLLIGLLKSLVISIMAVERKESPMNPADMLHQMCHSLLAATDVKALCKARGLAPEAAK